MAPVRLWPADLERYRAEAADVARRVVAAVEPVGTTGPAEFVASLRTLSASRPAIAAEGAQEREICGVPCRVLRPDRPARGIYLHLHGGGFVSGSALGSDVANAELVARAGVAVVSVDYRLAPEFPAPAAADDVHGVACWLAGHAATELGTPRIVIGGESAGGHLAVQTLLRMRDAGRSLAPFRGVNLIYTGFDLGLGTPSQQGRRSTTVPDLLDPHSLELIGDCYLPGTTPPGRRAPLFSPLYADLRGLPPALFTIGSADHLLDDSLLMAARWAAQGNTADLRVYPDCPHGFLRSGTELARRATDVIVEFLVGVLDPDYDPASEGDT